MAPSSPAAERARFRPLSALKAHAALLTLLAVGLVLRLHRLDERSLWNDELATVYRISGASLGETFQRIARDVHPPGYYLSMLGVTTLFGDGASALRFPSAIFGTATIAAVYALGARLGGRPTALAGAVLVTFSWHLIRYSQNARAFALLTLCVVAAAYFFHKNGADALARRPLATGSLVAHALWSAAAFYSHYLGVVFVGIGFALLGGLIAARRGSPRALLALPLAALAYAPWAPWFIDDLARGGKRPEADAPALTEALTVGVPAEVLLVGVAGLLVAALTRRGQIEKAPLAAPVAFLAAWLVLPIALLWARSQGETSLWMARSLEPTVPALLLLVALGVAQLPSPAVVLGARSWPVVPIAAVVGLCALVAREPEDQRHQIPREDFRGAAAHVLAVEPRARDAPIVSLAWQQAYFDYYFEKLGSERRVAQNATTPREALDLVRRELSSRPEVWLIAGHHHIPDSLPRRLEREGVRVHGVELAGAQALLFSRRATPRH